MNDERLEPNQILAARCTSHTHRHVSAHIHTYDAWPTSHAHYTHHTYTHACIHALMHQCIHIKAIVVCICTYIYIHTYRAQTTDMTCIRIYITDIAWVHIVVYSFFRGSCEMCTVASESFCCALEHQTSVTSQRSIDLRPVRIDYLRTA